MLLGNRYNPSVSMLCPESTVSHTTNKTHRVAQLMRIMGGGEEDGGLRRLSAELDVARVRAMDISRSVLVAALSEKPMAFKTRPGG